VTRDGSLLRELREGPLILLPKSRILRQRMDTEEGWQFLEL
jgi:hypothetical protein